LQRENKERPYRRIFETICDGLILNDIETGLVVEANPAASALHGYPREELIGLPLTAIIHPDSVAQFTESTEAVQAGKMFEATLVHVRRDGTPFTVEVCGTGCTYQDRLCLLNVVRDVSSRVQAEQLLRQQVEARTREQSTLLEISQTLASALDLKPGSHWTSWTWSPWPYAGRSGSSRRCPSASS
jgi:PAS domain S-box-containing protein